MSTGNGGDDDDGDDDLDVELAEHEPHDDALVVSEASGAPAPKRAAALDDASLELFREPEPGDEGDEAGIATQAMESTAPPPLIR